MPQPESRIVKKIREYLHSKGAVTFKIHGGDNPFQEVGIPDLLCCIRGRFVAVEVKTPEGKLSPLQERNLDRIANAGGVAITARSIDDVAEQLKGVL